MDLREETKHGLRQIRCEIEERITALQRDEPNAVTGSVLIDLIPGFERKAFRKLVDGADNRSNPVFTAESLLRTLGAEGQPLAKLRSDDFPGVARFTALFGNWVRSAKWRKAADLLSEDLGYGDPDTAQAELGGETVTTLAGKTGNDTTVPASDPKRGQALVEELVSFGVYVRPTNIGGTNPQLMIELTFGEASFVDAGIKYRIAPNHGSIRLRLERAIIPRGRGEVYPFASDEKTRLRVRRFRTKAPGWDFDNPERGALLHGDFPYFELCEIEGEIAPEDVALLCFSECGFQIGFDDEETLADQLDPTPGSPAAEEGRKLLEAWICSRKLRSRSTADGLLVLSSPPLVNERW